MKKCRKNNGYSIAEILLVFGIIAGVLTGVWGYVYHAQQEQPGTERHR